MTEWTYVTRRKPFGPFFAASGFRGTWTEADLASRDVAADESLEVWIVPATDTEVEVAEGRTVRIRDIAAERAQRQAVIDLVAYFDAQRDKPFGSASDWLLRAAQRFAHYEGDPSDRRAVARAILEHPNMQDTPRNRANGYRPYTTPSELYSRILRACS